MASDPDDKGDAAVPARWASTPLALWGYMAWGAALIIGSGIRIALVSAARTVRGKGPTDD